MDLKSKIILIFGPTASGKSSFAIKFAKKVNGEIINADSMQVYKQFKILSARPDPKKYQKINENDLLAIYDVGAYGMALSSNYNLRTKPAEILVDRSKVKVITKRQLIKNLI